MKKSFKEKWKEAKKKTAAIGLLVAMLLIANFQTSYGETSVNEWILENFDGSIQGYTYGDSSVVINKTLSQTSTGLGLLVEYDASSGGTWGIGREIDSSLLGWGKITFDLKASSSLPIKLKLIELGKDNKDGETWSYEFLSSSSFTTIKAAFQQFSKDTIQPSGEDNNQILDLSKIKTLCIEISQKSIGNLLLDNIKLIGSGTPKPTPTATPTPTPTCGYTPTPSDNIRIVDNFEDSPYWYAFAGSGSLAAWEIVSKEDGKKLKVDYTMAQGGYWGVGSELRSDWKGWQAISFDIQCEKATKFKFKVIENGTDGVKEGENWIYVFEVESGRKTIEIPLKLFLKDPNFQPLNQDKSNTFDLEKIRSINIENGDGSSGSFVLDNLMLKGFSMVEETPVPTATTNPYMEISGSLSLKQQEAEGVEVSIQGTSYKSIADDKGTFLFTMVPKSISNYTLLFSKEGLLERRMTIPAYKNIDVGVVQLWLGDMPVNGKGDGAVNFVDIMDIAKSFNTVTGSSEYVALRDMDKDGAVNMKDIMMVAENFNRVSGDYEEWNHNMDVFGFSQGGTNGRDFQTFELNPDMILRGWSKWDVYGTKPEHYNFKYVEECHQNDVMFIGGTTASMLFEDEASTTQQFLDWATRDAEGNLVLHKEVNGYRGSLANPSYRKYLMEIGKIQIDGGVDGLFYDEADGGYTGALWDGDEGFDDYFCKDFNKYLMEKYPNYKEKDWQTFFQMTEKNIIKKDVPWDDLQNNFNYRQYLLANGWSKTPFTLVNPLAKEWGIQIQNRPQYGQDNFRAVYGMKYWKEIVDGLRDYAKTKYNKRIYITSNGIFPYVDFQSIGLYPYNKDDNGREVKYVPVFNGRLNGKASLVSDYLRLKEANDRIAGNVPVVLFLDWPTAMMDSYYGFSTEEKKDFWRIYGAESYACGTPLAFHLKTSMPGEPTAKESGILEFLAEYQKFFKENASVYKGYKVVGTDVETSLEDLSTVVTKKQDGSTNVHLINHHYEAGIKKQSDFQAVIPLDKNPLGIEMISPDFKGSKSPKFTYSNGKLYINVEELTYYNIIKIKTTS